MLAVLPHHISCAVYVQSVITKANGDDAWSDAVPLESQRKLLIGALKLIKSSDITWSSFQMSIRSLVDKDSFSNILKDIYANQNIEQLMEFVRVLELLFDQKEQRLKKSSVLGLYVRRLILDFKKLNFEMVGKLCASIRDYINSPVADKINESENGIDMEVGNMEESLLEEEKENVASLLVNDYSNKSMHSGPVLSRNNVVRFISEQVKFIERNDSKALNPKAMNQKNDEIRKLYPDIYEVYYLSFLNYLRVSETNRATVALQMYFDYKVFQENEDLPALEKHQLKFKRFRYCALNLGIMHCHHSNYSEALISLEEAIRVAQETNDKKCLNHAMFWLSLVKEETGCVHEGEAHLKQFIAESSREVLESDGTTTCQTIDFLGILRFIKLQALKGGDKPAKLLSTVTQLIICGPSVAKTAELVRSTLLQFYGFSSMAAITSQNVLQSLQGNHVLNDEGSVSEEELTLSHCHVAEHHVSEGFYHEALSVLAFAKSKFPIYSPHMKTINLCEMKAHFKLLLAKREIEEAISISKSIYKLDKEEGKYAFAVVDVFCGNFVRAYEAIEEVLGAIDVHGFSFSPGLKVQFLLLRIEIILLSANPSQAMFKILELIAFLDSRYMNGLKIDANICLAHFQLQHGFAAKANELVSNMIIGALAHGTCLQKGMLFFLQYKCRNNESINNSNEEEKSQLLHSLSLLDKCLQHFRKGNFKAKMKDIYYEEAIIFNKLDYVQERNKSSTQFRLLHERLKDVPNVLLL